MIQLGKLLLVAMIMIALLGACKEIETIDVSPEFAIPLINTSLSIQDVLDQANTGDIVQVDGNNFITLNYRKEVLSTDTVELITVPPFSIPQLLTTQTVPTPFPSNYRIDEIVVKNSKLYISFESVAVNDFTVNLRIPSIKQGNNQLEYTMNVVNPSGVTPFIYEDSIDIGGYRINLQNGNFTSEYDATDDATSVPVLLSNFILDFPAVDFSYIEGYFGQRSFIIPMEQQTLDLFGQWKSGQVTFTQPKIRLRFDNSYGFPLSVYFDTLQAVTRDAGDFDILVNGANVNRLINFPALNEVGQDKRTNIVIDNANSNVVAALEQVPYGLRYQFSGAANPNGDSTSTGFATDGSRLALMVIAELPMEGAVQDFTLIDTFDLDLTGGNIPEGEAEFKIIGNNGFPLDIDLQCYFLDGFGQVIDSIFTGPNTNLLDAAPIDANGRVTTSVETITFAGFTLDRINNIRQNVTKIALQGQFNTTNNGNTTIKLYSDYELGIKIGVKVKPVFD